MNRVPARWTAPATTGSERPGSQVHTKTRSTLSEVVIWFSWVDSVDMRRHQGKALIPASPHASQFSAVFRAEQGDSYHCRRVEDSSDCGSWCTALNGEDGGCRNTDALG